MREKGWLGFIFIYQEDVDKILWDQWFCEKAYLILKPWNLGFDAWEEFTKDTLVCVKLPRIQWRFGMPHSLEPIRNLLVISYLQMILINSIIANESYKLHSACSIMKILVEINVSLGLFKSMEIELGSSKHL